MDEITLRLAQKGDAAAFERLVTPYEGYVWRVCWHYINYHEDAKDCAQETMVKAWKALPRYRGECSLETWLYRIAASCCLDHLRKQKRCAAESTEALGESGFDPADPSPQPEETAIAKDDKTRLRAAIAQLPEDMRTALILSAIEGRKYEEIAEITGAAVGTVKSRINRARLRLSQILSEKAEQSAAKCVQSSERRAAR